MLFNLSFTEQSYQLAPKLYHNQEFRQVIDSFAGHAGQQDRAEITLLFTKVFCSEVDINNFKSVLFSKFNLDLDSLETITEIVKKALTVPNFDEIPPLEDIPTLPETEAKTQMEVKKSAEDDRADDFADRISNNLGWNAFFRDEIQGELKEYSIPENAIRNLVKEYLQGKNVNISLVNKHFSTKDIQLKEYFLEPICEWLRVLLCQYEFDEESTKHGGPKIPEVYDLQWPNNNLGTERFQNKKELISFFNRFENKDDLGKESFLLQAVWDNLFSQK